MENGFTVECLDRDGNTHVYNMENYDKTLNFVAGILTDDICHHAKTKGKELSKEVIFKDIHSELEQTDQDSIGGMISHTIKGTWESYGMSEYKNITIKPTVKNN